MERSNDSSNILHEEGIYTLKNTPEVRATINPQLGQTEFSQDSVSAHSKNHSEFISSNYGDDSTSQLGDLLGNGKIRGSSQTVNDSPCIGRHTTPNLYLHMTCSLNLILHGLIFVVEVAINEKFSLTIIWLILWQIPMKTIMWKRNFQRSK